MYQLVKRCYIYGILIVHVIEKIHNNVTFKEYFQIVYLTNAMLIILTYTAIGNRDNVITIWDVSWYFYKSKDIQFLMQMIDKKSDR